MFSLCMKNVHVVQIIVSECNFWYRYHFFCCFFILVLQRSQDQTMVLRRPRNGLSHSLLILPTRCGVWSSGDWCFLGFIGFPIFFSFITPKGPRIKGNLDSFSKCFCQMVQLYSISMSPVIELRFFLTSSMKWLQHSTIIINIRNTSILG